MTRPSSSRYDAVLFDLLTALLDSWSLWSAVAGDAETGSRWRGEYLRLTYGVGSYRSYEGLVAELAGGVRVGVVTNCSTELGRRAAGQLGVQLDTVVTAEDAGAYKDARLVTRPDRHGPRRTARPARRAPVADPLPADVLNGR